MVRRDDNNIKAPSDLLLVLKLYIAIIFVNGNRTPASRSQALNISLFYHTFFYHGLVCRHGSEGEHSPLI